MNKRGISGVVVTVLLVLIAILAIFLIWFILRGFIAKSASRIHTECLTSNLEIADARFDIENEKVYVQIERKPGKGNITRIRFKFHNSGGSFIMDRNTSLKELETKTFVFDSIEVGDVSDIYKVEIAAIVSVREIEDVCRLCDSKKLQDVGGGEEEDGGNGDGEVGGECILTNAYWSTNFTKEGDIVSLIVIGLNCDNKELSFKIWERDGFSPGVFPYYLDDPVKQNPPNTFFGGNIANVTWTAEYQTDGISGNPEYYFLATLIESRDSINSGLLEVVPKEICNDGKDNDQDGLTDCNDPDCINGFFCAETGHVLESFEDGDIKEYVGDVSDFKVVNGLGGVSVKGSYSLSSEIIYARKIIIRDNITVSQGNAYEWYVKPDSTGEQQSAGFIFGYQNSKNYYFVSLLHSPQVKSLSLRKVVNGAYYKLDGVIIDEGIDLINFWHKFRLEWKVGGDMNLIWSGGQEILNAHDNTWTNGKFGFLIQNWESYTQKVGFDHVTEEEIYPSP